MTAADGRSPADDLLYLNTEDTASKTTDPSIDYQSDSGNNSQSDPSTDYQADPESLPVGLCHYPVYSLHPSLRQVAL